MIFAKIYYYNQIKMPKLFFAEGVQYPLQINSVIVPPKTDLECRL